MADFICISQLSTRAMIWHVKTLAIGIAKAIYRDIFILSLPFAWIDVYNPVEVSIAI